MRTANTRVLVAADDFYGVLGAVRALREAGLEVWIATSETGTYAARSNAAAGVSKVPGASENPEGFVTELSRIAAGLSVEAVIPGSETHLLTLAGRDGCFPGVAFGVPPLKTVRRAIDKGLLPELARQAGLRTPPTLAVLLDKEVGLREFGFPAIIKPRSSRLRNPDGTSSGTPRYVENVHEARQALRALPGGRGLLQPFVRGDLIGVAGVSWNERLVCAVHQRSERIWPVPTGGSSYAKTISPNEVLEAGLNSLLENLRWDGLFQAQFLRDEAGDHYLIDFNPRVHGSISLAVRAGMNLPLIWLELLLGRTPDVGEYRTGVRFRNEEKDLLALARMFARGERRAALRASLPKPDTVHAVFSPQDLRPSLVSVGNFAEKFSKRFLKR